jgi:hypothetical protein
LRIESSKPCEIGLDANHAQANRASLLIDGVDLTDEQPFARRPFDNDSADLPNRVRHGFLFGCVLVVARPNSTRRRIASPCVGISGCARRHSSIRRTRSLLIRNELAVLLNAALELGRQAPQSSNGRDADVAA